MKINKRLKHIANYVDDNCNVIDVGCDHALLSIYLEKHKKNISIIASDIKEGPLEQAKKNIEIYKSKKVVLKIGNGISTVDSSTDTVIISGMGANTILNILSNNQDKLVNIKKMILSPNNDFYLLRKTLSKFEYVIQYEEFVFDRGKYYPIMICVKGNKKYSDFELNYGVNVVLNNDYILYLQWLLSQYEKFAMIVPSDKKILYDEKIRNINKIISKYRNTKLT